MTAFRVVIPARYASTRFPGKPLAVFGGKPMVQHVHERAAASGAASVIVATDDERIAAACRAFGADVALTRSDHTSGTERVAEVARARAWPADSLVVNLQGDSPLMPPESIRQVAELLDEHPGAAVATLCTPIVAEAQYRSPDIVKVVMDAAGRALYFSRAPIPCTAHGVCSPPRAWRHLGIYGYRAGGLLSLASAAPCELESVEKLEQLRVLWLGLEIRVAPASREHGPDVDTPEDIPVVEQFLAGMSL